MPRKIRVDQIDHHQPGGGWLFGHGPDKGPVARGHERDPIHVTRHGGRYRIWDGNKRLRDARACGQKYIEAKVW